MLIPHPRDLRAALTRYTEARREDDHRPTDATARAAEDAAYTLCVITGTAAVPEALARAGELLEREAVVFPAAPPRSAGSGGSGDGLVTA